MQISQPTPSIQAPPIILMLENSGRPAAAEAAETLDAAAIARSALWARISGFFRRLRTG